MMKGNRFLKIDTPELMTHLKQKVEQSGRLLFNGAADGMEYLRRYKHAEHRD